MASRRHIFTALAFATALASLALSTPAAAEPPLGQIDLLAGTVAGYAPPGDNVAAIVARVNGPADVAALPDGSVLIADQGNNRIRRVDTAGTITTVAGTGTAGAVGDGGPAAAAQLNGPTGVASTADGGYLIADTNNREVRRVSPNGTITTIAGTGPAANCTTFPCGDGGAATAAQLSLPQDVAATADGGFLVSDLEVNVVRKVSAGGIISRVAGNYGPPGFNGDGGPAVAPVARLSDPVGLAPTPDGGFLIADSGNHRIRKVSSGGTITTVAGNETTCPGGTCGDGGPATLAQLNLPQGVVSRPDGSFYIGDTGDNRVRRVSANGATISDAAGDPNGTAGSSGDGGTATSAQLSEPRGLDRCGNSVLVADFRNQRVRWFGAPPIAGTTPCIPPPAPITSVSSTPPTAGGATPAPRPPPPAVLPALPPPVLGSAIDVTPISGVVLVRLPGQSGFTPLGGAANLPIGTEFDTTGGTVEVDFVTGVDDPHSAVVSQGLFGTAQAGATGWALQLPLTGKLKGCPRTGRVTRAAARAAKAGTRRVNVKAKGPVKTRRRYGAATVRGTAWTITDRCNTARAGTLVAVTEGVVAVSGQVKHKTVVVRAGKRYFIDARAKRRR